MEKLQSIKMTKQFISGPIMDSLKRIDTINNLCCDTVTSLKNKIGIIRTDKNGNKYIVKNIEVI